MSSRRSSRSSRACTPRSSTSAPGSSTRAHISSRCSRGAVVPRISVRPVGDHLRGPGQLAGPERGRLGADSRSAWSAATSTSPEVRASGTAATITRSRSRRSRSSANRRRVLADLDHLVHAGEHPARIPGGEGVDELVQQRVRRVAEQRGRLPVRPAVLVGPAQQLVQHRQRVPHRAGAGPDDQRQHRRLDRRSPPPRTAWPGSRRAPAAAPAGTGSGGSSTRWCRSPCPARWWRRRT